MTFEDTIAEHSKAFVFENSFRTITRKNGSEIITVADGKITATILDISKDTAKSTIELVNDLPFQPIEILMNYNEDLLCLYDSLNVWLVSLNKEHSLIEHVIKYKIELHLKAAETVLQVIFNNISKYQSEIVVLTTKEIVAYNINSSLSLPTTTYNFETANSFSSMTSNAYDSTIVDPVSICFASVQSNNNFRKSLNSPQNDITLFLLTSDASLFKIYPFFPSELSVTEAWTSDLFDTISMMFKSVDDETEQLEYLSAVKIAALLCETEDKKSIKISKTLPDHMHGKLAGPISMELYPDELYSNNALKIIPLENDVLAIVYDQTIAVFNRAPSFKMRCKYEDFEFDESILLADTVFINPEQSSILTAIANPVTFDSIFATFSNGTVLQIDFSSWMDSLSAGLQTGDLSKFTELCQSEKLPTSIVNLGKTNIVDDELPEMSYPLRSNENNIFFAWNTSSIYCMFLKQNTTDILSVVLIKEYAVTKDSQFESVPTFEVNEKKQYQSLLVSTFASEILPQIKKSLLKIAELNEAIRCFPTVVLDEQNPTVESLSHIHKVSESVSASQLILFKIFSLLSNRLKMMTMEYHHQIDTYNQIMLKKDDILQKFLKLKSAFSRICDKQDKLLVKMAKVMDDTELLESKTNIKSISISYQEQSYFRELSRMKDFILRKESELETLTKLLEDVKSAETGIMKTNRAEMWNKFGYATRAKSLKRQLEEQQSFLQHLMDKVNSLNKST